MYKLCCVSVPHGWNPNFKKGGPEEKGAVLRLINSLSYCDAAINSWGGMKGGAERYVAPALYSVDRLYLTFPPISLFYVLVTVMIRPPCVQRDRRGFIGPSWS